MDISEWISLGNFVVGVIGLIVGIIGGKELHEAKKLKIAIKEMKVQIEKMDISNSQVATTIHNNGLNLKDVDYVTNKIVDQKIEELPKIRSGYGPPDNSLGKDGDIYIQLEEE